MALLLGTPVGALAQQTVAASVTVTAAEPLPLDAPDRSVRSFALDTVDAKAALPLYQSAVDLLRLDSSLSVQERSPGGVQADLSLRGTTFEQTLVLVDGLRLNDPETGHLNLDLALPLEAFSRVDVLHGAGSTLFGSDAIGGAVNLVTFSPTHAEASLRLGGGSLGITEQHLQLAGVTRRVAARLTADRDTSDGFFYAGQDDRGYHSNVAALDTFLTLTPKLAPTEILLGASDRPYGANLFYGPYDSAERTKGWLAAIRQPLPKGFFADFSFRRHTDEFILLVQAPSVYENNHKDTLWQADVRRASTFSSRFELAYGLEADGDAISSNSLGRHARNQGAGYASLTAHSLRRLTLSVGAREEVLHEIGVGAVQVFTPTAAAGYDLSHGLRLHAAAGRGFRLPTYVDLYYADPTTIGNPDLKPETSQSYEGGIDFRQGRLTLGATGYTLRQSNAIDYAKTVASAPYQATNIGQIAYTGVETMAQYRLAPHQHFDLDYTFVHAPSAAAGLISEYAYNYASNNGSFAWQGVWSQLAARTQVSVSQQTQRTAYPLWTVALSRSKGLVRPYVRATDLANVSYQELPGVPLTGRTIMGGVVLTWTQR
jgi:iron complex outermembrane receptor protein